VSIRKTFFADTIEGAMAGARRELGDEALLLESRSSRIDERHLGAYALEFELAQDAARSSNLRQVVIPGGIGTPAPVSGDFAAMQSEVAHLSLMVSRLAARASGFHYSTELTSLASRLLSSGIPETLAHNILDGVERRLGSLGRARSVSNIEAQRALAVELEARLDASAELCSAKQARRVVALVGPAGAGKTTTLVKLAVRFGVAARKPTLIVSTDCHRVAATDQLKSYASILGLPFLLVGSPGALVTGLQEHRHKELVLIDSPGFGDAEGECSDDCASILSEAPSLETHIVLSATTRFADMELALRRWSRFHPQHLILTHLDDTESFGDCLGAAMKNQLPVSYLCGGQRIPEDLEPATKARLLQMLFGAQAASFAAVA
jgi:flagellar biosynthesis protein FlhF